MLTKKDFKEFAHILNKNKYSDGEFGSNLLKDMVNYFNKDNPKFDEVKFIEAVNK